MEFSIKSGNAEKQRTACIIAGIFEPRRCSAVATYLDSVSQGYITAILRRGDLEGKCGQFLLLHNVPNILSDRLLLVGCGRERDLADVQFRLIVQTSVRALTDRGAMEAVFYLSELPVRGRDLSWKIRASVLAIFESIYVFDRLKSQKNISRRALRKVIFNVPTRRDLAEGETALAEGIAIGRGMQLAKDLGNLPANICTPQYLADTASELGQQVQNLKIQVIEQIDIEKLAMAAFLSVAKGSCQAPKLIVMRYSGGDIEQRPVVLIGKGVTFDAGGISLKPAPDMDLMKFDMCGAAAVIGTLKVIAELKLPINVVGIVVAAENLPDGQANKPGDVITSMAGLSIEILNTDAEGRLLLCDALTYAERFYPISVIDIATLTGACVVALGRHASGLFSNHTPLANDLLQAGKTTGDRVWQMPLWDEYHDQLKSNFADLANVGGKDGGSIIAACFLSKFAKKYHWAHLDIAGTAWLTGEKKGATGRPVPLLCQYLLNLCLSQPK